MGLIDQLALRAAGAAGQYQTGRRAGEQERYKRTTADREREDALKREALQQAILTQRDAQAEQFRRDQLNQGEAYRRDALEQSKADRAAAREQQVAIVREQIAARADQARRDREARADQARLVASLRPGKAEPPPKALPSSSVRDLNEWAALRDSAKDAAVAFSAIPEGQNVSGGVVGRVAGALGQFGIGTGAKGINSPTAIAARSKLANISTALGKLRSGGAITPQEYERLEGLIPNKNEDESVIRSKLDELNAYLERTLSRNLDTFEQSGYHVGGVRTGMGSAPTGSPPAGPGRDFDAEAKALLAKRRGARP